MNVAWNPGQSFTATNILLFASCGQTHELKILASFLIDPFALAGCQQPQKCFHIVLKQLFPETLVSNALIDKNVLFFHLIHLHVLDNNSGNYE